MTMLEMQFQSLRQCTSSMDPVIWNAYHLMNNRARAVCYAARNQQFRALSEMTVNKLMDSAPSQLNTMDSLKVSNKRDGMLHLVRCGRCGVMFIEAKPWKSDCGQEKKTSFFVCYWTGRFILLRHGSVTVNLFVVGLLAPHPTHNLEDQGLQRNIQDFVALNLRELTQEKVLITSGPMNLPRWWMMSETN
jgi:hypothetical protein